ncbi:MAG: LPS export ABC transporter periplasmic protein LptC [Alphaproteobacteria bacterium]|nr:LPS export ABC transporter periplasmic protein LptC [Alphaproteobacteria bacterium]
MPPLPATPAAGATPRPGRGGGLAWTPAAQPRRHHVAYSRLVSLLRYLLPILAVGLLALVAVWPQIQRGVEGMRLQTLQLDPNEVSTLRMSNARYQGLDERNRPYLLTADAAIQNPKDKNFLALEGPKADMTLESGAWVTISAASGVYDNAHKALDLMGTVRVFHDNGHTFETEIARVDLATGQIEGDDPVHGQGPSGTIDAEGFRVLKKGETIQFKGKSRLVVEPAAPSPLP